MAYILGVDCKIAYNTSGSAKSSSTYLTLAKDVTLNLSAGEADVTTRAADGWKEYATALIDGTVDFELVYDASDAGFTAVKNAFFNRTPIYFYITDGVSGSSSGGGLNAAFAITGFTISQPLEGAVTVSVSARPTYDGTLHPAWE